MVKVIRVEKRLVDSKEMEKSLNKVFKEIHENGEVIMDINSFESIKHGQNTLVYMIIVNDNKEE